LPLRHLPDRINPAGESSDCLALRVPISAAAQYSGAISRPLFAALDWLHSGLVGDYVAWIVAGLALFALAFALT